MRERPLSITPIAVLHFVFGGLGILCGLFGGVMLLSGGQTLMSQTSAGYNSPKVIQMQEEIQKTMESVPGFHVVPVVNTGGDLAISIIMIVSGIGLLQFRPWGRLLSIVYAVASIALKVFAAVHAMAFTIPAMNGFLNTHQATAPEEQFTLTIMRMTTFFPPIYYLLCMIYPIIVLIIMFRPAVVQAFRADYGSR
jgi:hypothetical protein